MQLRFTHKAHFTLFVNPSIRPSGYGDAKLFRPDANKLLRESETFSLAKTSRKLFSLRRHARLPCPSHENANAMLFTCPSSHGMKTRTRFVFLYCCSSAFGNPQLTTRTQPPSPFLFAMAGGTTRRWWRRFGAQHDDGGSGLEGGTLVSAAAATLWLRREKTLVVCALSSPLPCLLHTTPPSTSLRGHPFSDTIICCEPLLEGRWKLFREALPVLFTNLVFETVEYLMERLFQVCLGVDPGCDGVTEENKVVYNSTRVHTDHAADATEGRVLLFIVPNVPQR